MSDTELGRPIRLRFPAAGALNGGEDGAEGCGDWHLITDNSNSYAVSKFPDNLDGSRPPVRHAALLMSNKNTHLARSRLSLFIGHLVMVCPFYSFLLLPTAGSVIHTAREDQSYGTNRSPLPTPPKK